VTRDDAKVLLIAIYKKEKHFSEAFGAVARTTGEVSTQLSVQIGNCGHSGFAGSDRAPGKPD